MSKLLIPNSFQTPNIIVDEILPYLKGTEFKVLMYLIRKTFGWQKYEDRISLTQFEKGTLISRQHIIAALKVLRDYEIVTREKTTKGDIYKLNLEWAYNEKWLQNVTTLKVVTKSNQLQKVTRSGYKMLPEVVTKSNLHKPTIKPTNKTQMINININHCNCINCNSKNCHIRKKRKGKYPEVIHCKDCNCEFLKLENDEIKIIKKGTDFEAIECFDQYYKLHPNSENIFYQKPVALKMFQNLLDRCRTNGKKHKAKEIVLNRLENYFDNEFYEKVNWGIESFTKNFNSFSDQIDISYKEELIL